MLEVLNAGFRHGDAKVDTSGAYKGCFCYIKGFDNDGYPLLDLPSNSAQAIRAVYVINKYRFEEDLSDTADAVDKLAKGDTTIYYDQGEFISNKWVPATFGFTSAYWNAVEYSTNTTTMGARFDKPGGSTAQGNREKHWAWVGVGSATGAITGAWTSHRAGYLVGTSISSAAAGFKGTGITTPSRGAWAAQVTGFHFETSAKAYIRFKIPNFRFAV